MNLLNLIQQNNIFSLTPHLFSLIEIQIIYALQIRLRYITSFFKKMYTQVIFAVICQKQSHYISSNIIIDSIELYFRLCLEVSANLPFL